VWGLLRLPSGGGTARRERGGSGYQHDFIVARLVRTAEQANVAQSILVTALGIAGGAFFPVQAPGFVAGLSADSGPGCPDMSRILAVAGVEVRRFLRDRPNIFFVFIFLLLLILLLGSQFGAGSRQPLVSVAGGTGSYLEVKVSRQLERDGLRVTSGSPETLRAKLSRGRTDVGIFISDAAAAAFDDGQPADLEVVMSSQSSAQAALQSVRALVQAVDTGQRQLAVLEQAGVGRSEAAAALDQARKATQLPRMEIVDTNNVGQEFKGLAQLDLGAAQQLLLFVFLSTLTGAATLIQARRLGVIARMMSLRSLAATPSQVRRWRALALQWSKACTSWSARPCCSASIGGILSWRA